MLSTIQLLRFFNFGEAKKIAWSGCVEGAKPSGKRKKKMSSGGSEIALSNFSNNQVTSNNEKTCQSLLRNKRQPLTSRQRRELIAHSEYGGSSNQMIKTEALAFSS